ncbi:MFS transporter [Mucilaginibacter sp.]|jgi:MFS family permease|uniref:MFS transporter n=1 Tax=Mucilaginibacter sp. TaxID=1882438 RepID=UPI002633C349|nr:MFS transporter [Mucilaginibacter sp.]MDB5128501.1 putative arabinose efflux permease, family [Mucilaginibacter sp.]
MSTIIVDNQMVSIKKTSATYLTLLFILCFVSSVFGGAVSTLMSVYLPVVVKELQGDIAPGQVNYISGYINALFIFGWAIGGFSWGLISDKIGRKKALIYSIGCYGIFTFFTGLMPHWPGVMLCRFMSGFGVGGELVVAFTLISEVWPKKSKAVVTGILSIAFPVGIFSAGAINYIVSTWREGFYIGVVPILMALAGLFIVRESGKWLGHKYQSSPAAPNSLFAPANRKDVIIGSLMFGTMLIGLWAIFSWMPTWIQSLIATDAPKQRGLSMMCLGMGGLTGGFFSGWLVNLMGLRKSMLLCFAICVVMSFVLFKTNATFSPVIYAEIAVMALFFGASQGVLSAYIPQLFHTGIRATATGFCFNIGRLFTATAVLFIGVLVTALGGYGNAIFLFSLVFVLGFIVVLFVKDKEEGTDASEVNILSDNV